MYESFEDTGRLDKTIKGDVQSFLWAHIAWKSDSNWDERHQETSGFSLLCSILPT
jgi:hypothetical protein